MTDKELLELAAKAAGMAHNEKASAQKPGQKYWFGLWIDGANEWAQGHHWNPLTDDGDALRLAVKLHIHLYINQAVRVDYRIEGGVTVPLYEALEPDSCAATRRAIVRAAAEIGKA